MLENMRGVSNEQLLLLVDTIENTPPMAEPSILETTRSNMFDENWNELVETLNSVPNGAKKGVQSWKNMLIDWKASVKAQANDENSTLDDLGKRLLRLVEEEQGSSRAEIVRDYFMNAVQEDAMSLDMFQEQDTENIFRRPHPRRNRRRNFVLEHIVPEYLMHRKDRCLKALIESNIPLSGRTRKELMQMHLDRLHRVSQELETHIQDVQNRIQLIKDRWTHDCDDE